MKIKYEYVNETVEIEVSEYWGKVLEEMDKEYKNVERRETRRHEELNQNIDGTDWLKSKEETQDDAVIRKEKEKEITEAMQHLSEKQADVIVAVHYLGCGITEYAKLRGISQPTATERLRSAEKILKKIL